MWATETLLFGGKAYYESLLRDIVQAKFSIDAEVYIFDPDKIGLKIAEALIEAADRGVRVRLLVDAAGSAFGAEALEDIFAKSNVQLKWYGRFLAGGWLPAPWRLNRRNHRKVWIVDSSSAHIGSANVTESHLEYPLGGENWKDISLRVEGKEISFLESAFESAWSGWSASYQSSRAKNSSKTKEAPKLLELNDKFSRRLKLRKNLKVSMNLAKKRVWFANAYFAPNPQFVTSLVKAAHRGIDVRVLVPRVSDVFLMPIITFSYYEKLIKAGVKLYEYLPSVYHAKTRMIDDEAVIGSTNLDYRSFFYNLEVDAMVSHKNNIEMLAEDMQKDFLNSELVTLEKIRARPFWYRWLAKCLSLLRAWV